MLRDSPCLLPASLAEFVRIAVTVWGDGAPLPATCGRRSNHGEEDFFEYEKQEEQRQREAQGVTYRIGHPTVTV